MKNKNKKYALSMIVLGSILLVGCESKDYNDLNVWMKEQDKNVRGKIEALPPAKTFTPKNFVATQNPFELKEAISLSQMDNNKYAPDPNRRKEPLEGYSLDSVKMVGFLMTDKGPNAIINTVDRKVHYIGVNNYLGKDYGRVTKITEGQIVLDERFVGGDSAWATREAVVYLDDGTKNK